MEENKVKKHLRENKKVYISVGITTILVAGATFLVTKRVYVPKEVMAVQNSVDISKNVLYKSKIDVVLQNIVAKGHPGWVVRCIETGEVFASQAEAAKKMGLDAARISEFFAGAREHVNGYTFERLGLAPIENLA